MEVEEVEVEELEVVEMMRRRGGRWRMDMDEIL